MNKSLIEWYLVNLFCLYTSFPLKKDFNFFTNLFFADRPRLILTQTLLLQMLLSIKILKVVCVQRPLIIFLDVFIYLFIYLFKSDSRSITEKKAKTRQNKRHIKKETTLLNKKG